MKPLTILLVDDAQDFAEVLAWHLRETGHVVAYAANGRDGAALLDQQRFDLVITDMIMPIAGGVELIAAVKKIQPEARIVAISGGGALYTAEVALQNGKEIGADAVLLKPFGPESLTRAIERLFAEA